ncbi:MAG: UbiA family prenyltransferase, partial [Pirellulales bacterium]|nr:UbiA family prenyltransferase [Pirellulales bacterium]
ADVMMGFFFVAPMAAFDGRAALTLSLLVAASSLLYSAGMVLNDVFDYEEDCRERPERPLPSGRVSPPAARRFGWSLLIAGTAVAVVASAAIAGVGPAAVGVALAGWIVVYNKIFKHTMLGPIVLGICRMFNVVLGMAAAVDRLPDDSILVVEAIGLFIVGVSVLARGEAQQGRRAVIFLGVVLMMVAVGSLWWLPIWRPLVVQPSHWRLFVVLMATLVAWRCYPALMDPEPAVVQRTVGQSIRSLVVLDAAITVAVAGLAPGVAILLLLAPNILLGRWFYST